MIKIAVMLELTGTYGRGVLQGVMEFANLRSDWGFIKPPMFSPGFSKWNEWKHADGIVTMVQSVASINRIRRSGIPMVNTARTLSVRQLNQLRIPTVIPDDVAVSEMAFDHLFERHFREFGFCGHPVASWSLVRRDAFKAACERNNVAFSEFLDADQVSKNWLLSLKRPCAVLAGNDHYGWSMIDMCRENGISVPEEIAVLGVDNDITLNNMVRPTLSSVDLGTDRIGFEAAKMLEQFMRGKEFAGEILEVKPNGVFTRHSTDVFKIEDPAVAEAVKFIREHVSEPIAVEDVLAEVAVSRRNLERRFKKAMNRSLLDEIIRMRLNRASTLLRETSLDIDRIARQSGFSSHVRFTTVFHEVMKLTPTAYRRAHRPEAT